MSNYLRNRPFMLINFTYVLQDGQDSRKPEFALNAVWDPIENMAIVDRVSNKQMLESELILDIFEHKVIKCRDNSIDANKIFSIMVSRHLGEIKAALADWVKRDPANLERVQAFVAQYSKTDTKETTDDAGE